MSPYWLHLIDAGPLPGVGTAAILGDQAAAAAAAWDYVTKYLEADMNPFEVGKTYLIQTVTLYYVGRMVKTVGAFVELEDASWVHNTGRLSRLCRTGKFTGFPSTEARPRTEYVGRVGINPSSIVDYIPDEFQLPEESLV